MTGGLSTASAIAASTPRMAPPLKRQNAVFGLETA